MRKPEKYIYIYTHALPCEKELFNAALADYAVRVGADISKSAVAREEGGKPYLTGNTGIHFSVTHTNTLWACAFADAPVGLDAEMLSRKAREGIAERFFHPDEIAAIHNGADFFDIWTAKESYVKYTGEGIRNNFHTFTVIDGDGIAESVNGVQLRAWEMREHKFALCSKREAEIRFIDMEHI